MGKSVVIHGDGVAACCAARLLYRAGFSIRLTDRKRTKTPVILVSKPTQHLLGDIFEDATLFRDFAEIRTRIVRWGRDAVPVTVPHSGSVVSEQLLLDRLWKHVEFTDSDGAADWHIYSRAGSVPSGTDLHFGTRIAHTQTVQLNAAAEPHACWIESAESGWLFLLSRGDHLASLISVSSDVTRDLEQSRVIRPLIDGLDGPTNTFPAYPHLSSDLSGHDVQGRPWFACGGAAMTFDPLCGEGAGNAAREAILAAAAIRASAEGEPLEPLFSHYASRLLGGFMRHLSVCRSFYAAGHGGVWWEHELAKLDEGLDRLKVQTTQHDPLYRLRGFDLEPLRERAGSR